MNKRIALLLIVIICLSFVQVNGQELQARLSVLTNRISSNVDKKVFNTLQSTLLNFVNNRKWTTDDFDASEKIQCNFLLSIEQDLGDNVYKARLTVQAARPIYGSTYESPLVNFIDDNVVFKYAEFQPFEFNENRVQGNDPLVANLPAVFAYYINIILGMDYSSFSLRGGDRFFRKAQSIVNNAPESKDITGWKSIESLRNRYWLAENLNNNRFALIHNALYSYYRKGFDIFRDNEEEGRTAIFNAINQLNQINTQNPNSMLLQFFFQGKNTELVKIFEKANADLKKRAVEMLAKLDITNAQSYNNIK